MSARRIGTFVCACGGNISDHVDIERVRDGVSTLDGVATARTFQFACSEASQEEMAAAIRDEHLDGLVIASCSPKLHLGTFRAMAERAGLNQYLYAHANIREQCSWAHRHDHEAATVKATDLVRAGVARARLGEPLKPLRVETIPHVLVVGAGVAGLRAALALDALGLGVTVVEREPVAGGRIAAWGKLFPDDREGTALVASLLEQVRRSKGIALHTSAALVGKEGSVGHFRVELRLAEGRTRSLEVGAIIVATGAASKDPEPGQLGSGLPGVVTLPELRQMLAASEGRLRRDGRDVKTVVYVYCAGDPEYCSRTCCTAAVHTALLAQAVDPELDQVHVYREMRTYGKQELMFEDASRRGSVFIRRGDEPPEVEASDGGLVVKVADQLLGGEPIEVPADLVVLVTGAVAHENQQLNDLLKLPVGKGGFFQEVHPKLRPVETLSAGVFIAGAAQGPRNLAESVASGLAAAAKSAALLLRGHVEISPLVARVDAEACTYCDACKEACPYPGAVVKRTHGSKEVAFIEPSLCKGCGACVPVCPADAVGIAGSGTREVTAMIDALAGGVR